jgi:hypothetical protein
MQTGTRHLSVPLLREELSASTRAKWLWFLLLHFLVLPNLGGTLVWDFYLAMAVTGRAYFLWPRKRSLQNLLNLWRI